VYFIQASHIEKSLGLYKYIENKLVNDIIQFIDALKKSGNRRAVLVLRLTDESRTTSQHVQQNTGSNNLQPSSNLPSSARPHDSATKTKPSSYGNCKNPVKYNVINQNSS
jgi:hypothetical protein